MPIQKDYETPSTGAVATYHVVKQVSLDYDAAQTNATVSSYLSKDARDAGKFPMHTQQIPLEQLPAAAQDARDYAEAQLIAAAPDDAVVTPYANRYAFAGGSIVE